MNPVKIVAVVAVVALVISGLAFFNTGAKAISDNSQVTIYKIQQKGTLDVCYAVWGASEFVDLNTGKVSGEFIDAMDFIAGLTNVKVAYHETTFANFSAALQSHRCDVSIAATFKTIPRATAVAFTHPLGFIGNSAIIRKEDTNRFKTLEDIDQKDVRVAVVQGEASDEYTKAHFKNATITRINSADLSLAMAEVSSGHADVGMSDAVTTRDYASAHPEVIDLFGGKPYDLIGFGWAVRPEDTQLLEFLNTSIDYLQTTGRLDELSQKYHANWLNQQIVYEAN